VTEALAGCVVETKLPLETHHCHVEKDSEPVLLKVLNHQIINVILTVEIVVPGVHLGFDRSVLSICLARSEHGFTHGVCLVSEQLPLFLVVPDLTNG